MNKFLLAAAACCVMGAGSMFATNLTCLSFPVSFANGAGSTSVTCPSFSVPLGDSLTSVDVWYESDYQFGTTNNSVSVVFTPGVDFVTSPTTCVVSGPNSSSSANSCGAYSGIVSAPGTTEVSALPADFAALAAGGFTVGISSSVTSGSVATSSAGVIVEYDYAPTSSGAPEPSSMILLGSGLLAAGLIGRKKFATKK